MLGRELPHDILLVFKCTFTSFVLLSTDADVAIVAAGFDGAYHLHLLAQQWRTTPVLSSQNYCCYCEDMTDSY